VETFESWALITFCVNEFQKFIIWLVKYRTYLTDISEPSDTSLC